MTNSREITILSNVMLIVLHMGVAENFNMFLQLFVRIFFMKVDYPS